MREGNISFETPMGSVVSSVMSESMPMSSPICQPEKPRSFRYTGKKNSVVKMISRTIKKRYPVSMSLPFSAGAAPVCACLSVRHLLYTCLFPSCVQKLR